MRQEAIGALLRLAKVDAGQLGMLLAEAPMVLMLVRALGHCWDAFVRSNTSIIGTNRL